MPGWTHCIEELDDAVAVAYGWPLNLTDDEFLASFAYPKSHACGEARRADRQHAIKRGHPEKSIPAYCSAICGASIPKTAQKNFVGERAQCGRSIQC